MYIHIDIKDIVEAIYIYIYIYIDVIVNYIHV